jgi:DNA mismatch repair protein MutL
VPVRQVRLLYILAEASDGLYVVDQHAAHERVRYEALAADEAAGRPPARQRLLAPLIVDLAPGLVEVLVERQDEVAAAGFVAEPFGAASVRVREVPADLRLPGQVLRDLLAELADPSDRAPAAHRRRALLACRSAVRAGDALAPAEMARILEELGRCREGATCPHGRPTVRRLGWDEIAAWFRRRA